jgi:hypothetical protein
MPNSVSGTAIPLGAVVRDLPSQVTDRLWGLLARINELRELEENQRPVTIHWQATEVDFAGICEDLAAATPAGELWKVLTLLAMCAACPFGIDLEDGSYGEE